MKTPRYYLYMFSGLVKNLRPRRLLAFERRNRIPQSGETVLDVVPPLPLQRIVMGSLLLDRREVVLLQWIVFFVTLHIHVLLLVAGHVTLFYHGGVLHWYPGCCRCRGYGVVQWAVVLFVALGYDHVTMLSNKNLLHFHLQIDPEKGTLMSGKNRNRYWVLLVYCCGW